MAGPPGIAKGRLRGVGKGAFYVNSLIGIFSCLAASLFGWHEMSTFVFVYMVEFSFSFSFFVYYLHFLLFRHLQKSKKHGKTGLRKPSMLFSTLHLLLRYSLFLASHAYPVSLPYAFYICSITRAPMDGLGVGDCIELIFSNIWIHINEHQHKVDCFGCNQQ